MHKNLKSKRKTFTYFLPSDEDIKIFVEVEKTMNFTWGLQVQQGNRSKMLVLQSGQQLHAPKEVSGKPNQLKLHGGKDRQLRQRPLFETLAPIQQASNSVSVAKPFRRSASHSSVENDNNASRRVEAFGTDFQQTDGRLSKPRIHDLRSQCMKYKCM